jgi:hypothetical protein
LKRDGFAHISWPDALTAMTKHWISGARDHPIPTACAGCKNGEVTIAILRLVANNSNR